MIEGAHVGNDIQPVGVDSRPLKVGQKAVLSQEIAEPTTGR
jgi:hypothetical protein